jgi:hypothetical protein
MGALQTRCCIASGSLHSADIKSIQIHSLRLQIASYSKGLACFGCLGNKTGLGIWKVHSHPTFADYEIKMKAGAQAFALKARMALSLDLQGLTLDNICL